LLARVRHEYEPVEIDPQPGGCLDAQVGHADDGAPGSRRTWTLQQPERECRRVVDRVRAAGLECPARQELAERGVRRQGPSIERGALHAPDARLQVAHDINVVDWARSGWARFGRVEVVVDTESDGYSRGRGCHPSSFEHMFDYVNAGPTADRHTSRRWANART